MRPHLGFKVAGGSLVLLLLAAVFAFEPVTRNLVATDDLCAYCHVSQEYRSDVRLAYSKPHPAPATEPEDTTTENPQATCADCHLAPGLFNSVYAYTHFASLTDLFGHARDRMSERSGTWLPARQAAAYRVRDRLYEYDSLTCRQCHIEAEIEPKRQRGKNAHAKALEDQQTCIECHYNEKHRSVDLRDNAFAKTP